MLNRLVNGLDERLGIDRYKTSAGLLQPIFDSGNGLGGVSAFAGFF